MTDSKTVRHRDSSGKELHSKIGSISSQEISGLGKLDPRDRYGIKVVYQ